MQPRVSGIAAPPWGIGDGADQTLKGFDNTNV